MSLLLLVPAPILLVASLEDLKTGEVHDLLFVPVVIAGLVNLLAYGWSFIHALSWASICIVLLLSVRLGLGVADFYAFASSGLLIPDPYSFLVLSLAVFIVATTIRAKREEEKLVNVKYCMLPSIFIGYLLSLLVSLFG